MHASFAANSPLSSGVENALRLHFKAISRRRAITFCPRSCPLAPLGNQMAGGRPSPPESCDRPLALLFLLARDSHIMPLFPRSSPQPVLPFPGSDISHHRRLGPGRIDGAASKLPSPFFATWKVVHSWHFSDRSPLSSVSAFIWLALTPNYLLSEYDLDSSDCDLVHSRPILSRTCALVRPPLLQCSWEFRLQSLVHAAKFSISHMLSSFLP